ncbi:hypothetical protein L3067_13995 [Xanthomonas sp. PPL568]|uniref:hypothetical protein n=1 Tax=Xanthomonas indica TaxID=2912242 RepID=UPI001F56D604|nr:hypothetical protein [Xanthomonas indica]MCI2245716.1 hypothetical protein [Xanthomonas indica]
MPASLLTEVVLRPLFEIVLYGLCYVVGMIVVPAFSFGYYSVEPWSSKRRGKSGRRSAYLAPRVISADAAAFWGALALVGLGLLAYALWGPAGA